MDIKRIFGSEIKRKRKKLALSQESLAELANLSVHTISDLENAKISPKLETITAVGSVLDIDLNQFKNENIKNIRRD